MKIQLIRQSVDAIPSRWIILGIFEDESGPPRDLAGTSVGETVDRLRASKDISGSSGEVTVLHDPVVSVIVVGLGKKDRLDGGTAFYAMVAATKRIAGKPREDVALVLPDVPDRAAIAEAMIEGAIVGTRGPGLKLAEPNRHAFRSLSIVVTSDGNPIEIDSIRRAEVIGASVNLARDLVNTPPGEKSPARLADQIRAVAEEAGLSVEIWDADRIRAERFGGLLGVAAGSDEPPRFVILRHGKGGNAPTLALVGKGVTFDSGGLSLKPSASMEDMKSDMTGAAVVVSTLQAVARLGLPVNVAGYLALTENMTGGHAMKLGDVLTMRNGKTVEVLNTDAEGRLILADALSYAAEHSPARIIDLATLTGACMVALGPQIAGLFGNNDPLCEELQKVTQRTGERAWRMPLDDDFKEMLKSQVADLKNIGGKWGGAITAAKFLEQFVGSTPWAHLDIAGPSWSDSDQPRRDAGGTGCFVRTLVRFIAQTAENGG